MGWLFSESWRTRNALREHLVAGNGVTTLKSCWVGNNLWAVQEGTKTDGTVVRFICLYLCRYHGKDLYGWGYKDVDESMGPTETSCPIGYIELVESHEREHGYEPSGYAAEWRKRVRSRHALKTRKLEVGQKFKLYGRDYEVCEKLGRRGYRVLNDEGYFFRLRLSQIKDVECKEARDVCTA